MSPQRIAKIKPGRARALEASAVETMALWDQVRAVVRARTTAGKIRPKKALSRKSHPAKFRLTRTRGSTFGFVTFTATTRKYGTAKRNISWGKVRLSRTLTGTLTYVYHVEERSAGAPSPIYLVHEREQWQVTFRLTSRADPRWFGAARYRLAEGTWRADSEGRFVDYTCAGQGQGPAASGSVRYDWHGTRTSAGAGMYWLDLGSTQSYRSKCSNGGESDRRPSFTLGLEPATNGVHPDHLKGARRDQIAGPDEYGNGYESWAWDLRAP